MVVNIDPDTCEFEIYAEKTVVDKVEDDLTQISLTDARMKDPKYDLGMWCGWTSVPRSSAVSPPRMPRT